MLFERQHSLCKNLIIKLELMSCLKPNLYSMEFGRDFHSKIEIWKQADKDKAPNSEWGNKLGLGDPSKPSISVEYTSNGYHFIFIWILSSNLKYWSSYIAVSFQLFYFILFLPSDPNCTNRSLFLFFFRSVVLVIIFIDKFQWPST